MPCTHHMDMCNYMDVQVLLLLWSYFAAVLTDPGRVPPGWHPFADEQVCISHDCVVPCARAP